VNATSLLGRHGEIALELGWSLVEDGRAALVASDGHRPTRPARLDEAYALAVERVGEAAEALFTGEALGLSTRPIPSRAGLPAA
jgi:tyrosine-protein phosphatase YwqE